jgi:hypothetical protein
VAISTSHHRLSLRLKDAQTYGRNMQRGLLTNLLRHVETHNRLLEQNEAWAEYDRDQLRPTECGATRRSHHEGHHPTPTPHEVRRPTNRNRSRSRSRSRGRDYSPRQRNSCSPRRDYTSRDHHPSDRSHVEHHSNSQDRRQLECSCTLSLSLSLWIMHVCISCVCVTGFIPL